MLPRCSRCTAPPAEPPLTSREQDDEHALWRSMFVSVGKFQPPEKSPHLGRDQNRRMVFSSAVGLFLVGLTGEDRGRP